MFDSYVFVVGFYYVMTDLCVFLELLVNIVIVSNGILLNMGFSLRLNVACNSLWLG